MIDRNLYDENHELSTRDAAAVAQKNRRTIVAWINRGELAAMKNPGARGHYRVRWADLYELLHTPAVPKDK